MISIHHDDKYTPEAMSLCSNVPLEAMFLQATLLAIAIYNVSKSSVVTSSSLAVEEQGPQIIKPILNSD